MKRNFPAAKRSQKNMIGNVVETITDALTVSEVEAVAGNVVGRIKHGTDQILGQHRHDFERIEEIVAEMMGEGRLSSDVEISRSDLSRRLEISEEEFSRIPKGQLEVETLVRHIAFEHALKKWLKEWGYDVKTGDEIEGIGDIGFFPDIYAKRRTLYGNFEVIIYFICDSSPDVYRTYASLKTFESYAWSGFKFSERDVLIIATSFRFGAGLTQTVASQNQKEKYTVLALEGSDIVRLQEKTDSERLCELRKLVSAHEQTTEKVY